MWLNAKISVYIWLNAKTAVDAENKTKDCLEKWKRGI